VPRMTLGSEGFGIEMNQIGVGLDLRKRLVVMGAHLEVFEMV
jgi:hypothetical protein